MFEIASHWFSEMFVQFARNLWNFTSATILRDRVDERLTVSPVYDRNVKRYDDPLIHPTPQRFTSTRRPLCAIDIYGVIYILPNILSLGKWPRARAKLLNIQAGNEAKFVCVSARSRHWYTSGSSSSALLPDCILSRDGIILQYAVTRSVFAC